MREKRVFWNLHKNGLVHLNLYRGKNNTQLTNTVRISGTKLKVLKLRGNKLHYSYSIGGLTAIYP